MADTAVQQDKGLKSGALGLASSIVIGVSSTAPAYSSAASIGFVVVAASGAGIIGVKAPSIILLAFIPMFLIAMAYQQLNKAEPDCGTTFTWASRAFGPRVGWMGGWGIIAADVILLLLLLFIISPFPFPFPYSFCNGVRVDLEMELVRGEMLLMLIVMLVMVRVLVTKLTAAFLQEKKLLAPAIPLEDFPM